MISAPRVYSLTPGAATVIMENPLRLTNWMPGAHIDIFTVSGHRVRQLDGNAFILWDLKNDSGDLVGSGALSLRHY